MVPFEDFAKLELRIGKIMASERVEGSEKLLKLSVSLGDETRQILAGIGKRYDPEGLIGREIVVAVNLEPRMLMGLESQGMLLAADDDGPVLIAPEREVPQGSTIR